MIKIKNGFSIVFTGRTKVGRIVFDLKPGCKFGETGGTTLCKLFNLF